MNLAKNLKLRGIVMQLSKHAAVRSQQRGIPKAFIEMIMEYGTPTRKPGNALEYRLTKKIRDQIIREHKRVITFLEKCSNKAVLVDGDYTEVISVYHLH